MLISHLTTPHCKHVRFVYHRILTKIYWTKIIFLNYILFIINYKIRSESVTISSSIVRFFLPFINLYCHLRLYNLLEDETNSFSHIHYSNLIRIPIYFNSRQNFVKKSKLALTLNSFLLSRDTWKNKSVKFYHNIYNYSILTRTFN